MAKRYFKKLNPNVKVQISSGHLIEFSTVNHLVGYFGTDNEGLQKEFEKCMSSNRGGITEITEAEYMNDYVEAKKKSPILRPLSREEFGAGHKYETGNNPLTTLGPVAVAAAIVGKGNGALPISETATMADAPPSTGPQQKISATTPPEGFKPPMGKRFQKRTPPKE